MTQAIRRQFLWQWENYKPQDDPSMTSERALRLLNAWRGGSRRNVNGRKTFSIQLIRHIDRWNEYKVTHKFGESGSLWIRRESGQ
jgi:hypothetical protein